MIQVVAAIIEREGRILIGQRRPEQSHPLKWEFPGGKVEPGETPERALTRELEEELAIRNARGPEIARYEFTYPGKSPIALIFHRVTEFGRRAAKPDLPRKLGASRRFPPSISSKATAPSCAHSPQPSNCAVAGPWPVARGPWPVAHALMRAAFTLV